MKTCSKCSLEKSFEKFYKNPRYFDGYQGVCKKFQQERSREREPLKSSTYAKYRATNKGKLTRNNCQKRYAARHPEKIIAHNLARQLLKQQCEVCGNEKVHGHHDDYAKPLEVRWLCAKHHNEFHKQQNLVGG